MKNTLKKVLAVGFAAALALSALTGCGNKTVDDTNTDGDTKTETKTLTVAASSAPHAEILEQCKPILEKEGITLDIKVMDDYIIPNTSTESGDVDANYFQHTPYLEQFNEENGTHLVSVAKIHYEPYGIYTGTAKSFDELKEGDKVAVPNDATNEARALLLLEANGLIKLKDGVGLTATKNDIVENPKNLDIVEMEAALVPSQRDEAALAVINGNYAIANGISISEALATEDSESEAAQTFANIVVVKEGNEENELVKALVDALKSDEIKNFINEKYEGAVVPIN